MEGFVDVVEGVFWRDIAEGGARLDEVAEVVGGEVLVMEGVFIEDKEGFVAVPGGGFPHEEDVGVGAGEEMGGAFFLEDGVVSFDGVDAGDVVGEVEAGVFPVGRGGLDDMEGLTEGEFEADRHHEAGGEEGGEEVALFEGVEVALGFGRQAGGVVAFGEADGGGGFADEVVLFDQPPVAEVPVFGAIEHEVEAGLGGILGLVGGAAEGFGDEAGVGVGGFDVLEEAMPEGAGDLVGGVAAEALEAEAEEVFDDASAI